MDRSSAISVNKRHDGTVPVHLAGNLHDCRPETAWYVLKLTRQTNNSF
jgi:hypothetical protein